MSRLSVLFVVPHPIEGPSTRFRIHQFLPALEAAGIEHQVRPFLSSRLAPQVYAQGCLSRKLAITAWGAAQRLADVARSARVDLVYVLREAFPIGPPVLETAMASAAGRLVYDFDDAIWIKAINYENPLDRFRDWSRPAKLISISHRVVCGSEVLADYARQHAADPDRVVVIPTVVDTRTFIPNRRPPDGTVVVGWIGTPRNTGYIRDIWPALAEAYRAAPSIRFVFVGAEPFDVGDAPVTFRPWTLAAEVAEIQGFDIGIMPLPDNEQTRGKCAFKLIAYMACGAPCVASPIGANVDVLSGTGAGMLAQSPAAWVEALATLARETELRREMGRIGRELAQSRYSVEAVAPRFVANIEEAAHER
jgi:glycosyltransferase involved in cell wall biosynthesis